MRKACIRDSIWRTCYRPRRRQRRRSNSEQYWLPISGTWNYQNWSAFDHLQSKSILRFDPRRPQSSNPLAMKSRLMAILTNRPTLNLWGVKCGNWETERRSVPDGPNEDISLFWESAKSFFRAFSAFSVNLSIFGIFPENSELSLFSFCGFVYFLDFPGKFRLQTFQFCACGIYP